MTSGGLTKEQAAGLQTFSASESKEKMYDDMARTAREEGEDDLADWFEELAREHRKVMN